MSDSVTCTRTYVCPLETSNRKVDRVEKAIDEWQSIARTVVDHHPSFPEYEWGNTKRNSSFYRIASREHPDTDIMSGAKLEAVHKVGEAFSSWQSNGKGPDRPQFGDGSYCRYPADHISIQQNDSGFGIRVKLEAYEDPEWFNIAAGPFQYDVLERVVDEDDDADMGSAELHLDDNGNVSAHLSVKWGVEVLEPTETLTVVGVDVGERAIYAATCMDDEGVVDVDYQSGEEFRHHRERLTQRVYDLMEKGDLRGVKDCRGQRERYTEHVVHNASRSVVDMAVEHDATIAMEDLTGYRESAKEPIHDWPFAMFQEQVAYKATEEGIPVVTVDAAGTSTTCRKCGNSDSLSRQGVEFECTECGYEVNADVNAAINIAERAR